MKKICVVILVCAMLLMSCAYASEGPQGTYLYDTGDASSWYFIFEGDNVYMGQLDSYPRYGTYKTAGNTVVVSYSLSWDYDFVGMEALSYRTSETLKYDSASDTFRIDDLNNPASGLGRANYVRVDLDPYVFSDSSVISAAKKYCESDLQIYMAMAGQANAQSLKYLEVASAEIEKSTTAYKIVHCKGNFFGEDAYGNTIGKFNFDVIVQVNRWANIFGEKKVRVTKK